MTNLYLSLSKVQWRQTSWKVTTVHAQVEVAAQSIGHVVRTVCITQSCADVMTMKTETHIELTIKMFYVLMTMTTTGNRK